jgi:hypothetical protein
LIYHNGLYESVELEKMKFDGKFDALQGAVKQQPKTVREPLDSHGFRCSAADIEEPPVGKERWSGATNPSQPLSCSPGTTAQTLELLSRPAALN